MKRDHVPRSRKPPRFQLACKLAHNVPSPRTRRPLERVHQRSLDGVRRGSGSRNLALLVVVFRRFHSVVQATIGAGWCGRGLVFNPPLLHRDSSREERVPELGDLKVFHHVCATSCASVGWSLECSIATTLPAVCRARGRGDTS